MKYLSISLVIMLSLLGFNSCIHDDFEEPEIPDMPAGNVITISDLRQIYMDSVISGVHSEGYKFTENFSVYCTCTMDDKSGNIYKSAYVQDNTDAINLHLLSSGGIYEGDSIRLDVKGLILSDYENMLQLDSVHVDHNIMKIATQQYLEPELVTIPQIQTGNYQGKLVLIEKVQFEDASLGDTWADAENLETLNHNIEDCNGNTIIVRTSGYADFAGRTIPEGKGSLVAIVGQFRDDWQLAVRNMYEVDMEGYRCGTPLYEENFDGVVNGEAIALDAWKNIAIEGNVLWMGMNTQTLTAARITPNSDLVQQTWLITPQIEIPEGIVPALEFETRAAFDLGGTLKVFVSEDYDGGDDPSTATWIELSATICDAPSNNFGTWTESGLISLADYSDSIHIAFRYDGTDTQKTQYFIDKILVSMD
ncbi:MAG: DUF5689 domain-containing protein [Bacteroidales bacterium]|jgi:hypothetical protein|nr:DUF5689 domain-containing protein [Bacteroidales bacterium]